MALAFGDAAALDLGLFFGDLGDFGDFGDLDLDPLRLLRPFPRPLPLPFESLEPDLAGVAFLGFPALPSCLNLHSSPQLHLPCFQNLHTFDLSPLPDGDLPRLDPLLGSLPLPG